MYVYISHTLLDKSVGQLMYLDSLRVLLQSMNCRTDGCRVIYAI